MEGIKIVSSGPNAYDVKVLTHDGHEIRGITKLTIHPIERWRLITATMEFLVIEVNVTGVGDRVVRKVLHDSRES